MEGWGGEKKKKEKENVITVDEMRVIGDAIEEGGVGNTSSFFFSSFDLFFLLILYSFLQSTS